MKTYLISENTDTLVGFRLAGIQGYYLSKEDEIVEKLRSLAKMKDTGMIIVTQTIAKMVSEEILKLKLAKEFPLVVEVPNSDMSIQEDAVLKYIKEAIGLKI